MTLANGRMRRTMNSILTAIGLGGSSADTIEALLEHEGLSVPARDMQFSKPLNLMLANALMPRTLNGNHPRSHI